VQEAASNGNLKQNLALFEAVQGALHFSRSQLKAGDFEFEHADFVLEMVLVMHSFRTSIDLGTIGIETLVARATSALDRPFGRNGQHRFNCVAHA
jgi:hypothetical protein